MARNLVGRARASDGCGRPRGARPQRSTAIPSATGKTTTTSSSTRPGWTTASGLPRTVTLTLSMRTCRNGTPGLQERSDTVAHDGRPDDLHEAVRDRGGTSFGGFRISRSMTLPAFRHRCRSIYNRWAIPLVAIPTWLNSAGMLPRRGSSSKDCWSAVGRTLGGGR